MILLYNTAAALGMPVAHGQYISVEVHNNSQNIQLDFSYINDTSLEHYSSLTSDFHIREVKD